MMFSVLAQLLQLSTARILVRDRDLSGLSPVTSSETGFNNSCLVKDSSLNREGPREFNCARFVIESTDRLWNMYRDFDVVEGYLRQYMTEDWAQLNSLGPSLFRLESLTRQVLLKPVSLL